MKDLFYKGGIFHVFNKSISKFKIFRNSVDKNRFLEVCEFCNDKYQKVSYSEKNKSKHPFISKGLMLKNDNRIISIISYCLMEDHYHFIFKAESDKKDVFKYLNKIESSYSHYFNLKYKRKGPLWQNDYRSVEVSTSDQ